MSTLNSEQIKSSSLDLDDAQPAGAELDRTLSAKADLVITEIFAAAGCNKGTEESDRLAQALMEAFDLQDDEDGAYLALNDAAYMRSGHFFESQNSFRTPGGASRESV